MDVQGEAKNVNLRIDYITRTMLGNVPDLLIDLLEVAAYIYCADQRLGRGSDKLTNFGENWRRSLHFSVPVRLPEVWQHSDVQELLAETLGFLSDDSYSFDFRRADAPARRRPRASVSCTGLRGEQAGGPQSTLELERRAAGHEYC